MLLILASVRLISGPPQIDDFADAFYSSKLRSVVIDPSRGEMSLGIWRRGDTPAFFAKLSRASTWKNTKVSVTALTFTLNAPRFQFRIAKLRGSGEYAATLRARPTPNPNSTSWKLDLGRAIRGATVSGIFLDDTFDIQLLVTLSKRAYRNWPKSNPRFQRLKTRFPVKHASRYGLQSGGFEWFAELIDMERLLSLSCNSGHRAVLPREPMPRGK